MLDGTNFAGRETSDEYSRVVCLFEGHRVIEGRCKLQWVVQRSEKAAQTSRGSAWRALRYFQTKSALVEFWAGLHRAEACERWPELERLPDHFTGMYS